MCKLMSSDLKSLYFSCCKNLVKDRVLIFCIGYNIINIIEKCLKEVTM